MVIDKKHHGCEEEIYSQTTRLISGHNTSLPNLAHQALQTINRDQDSLLAQLKRKQHALEKKSLQASNFFSSFAGKMQEQQELPDQWTM